MRDEIPRILESRGIRFRLYRVEGEELCRLLIEKLREEVEELAKSMSVEEAADILEVLEAIARRCLGVEWSEVLRVRELKRRERGSFEMGYVIEVDS